MTLLLLALLQLSSPTHSALAQQNIAIGEPDPNLSPKSDNEKENLSLVDDRKPCPKGQTRMQKMECGLPDQAQECEHYRTVLECRKKPEQLNCKKPQVPVPVYHCEN